MTYNQQVYYGASVTSNIYLEKITYKQNSEDDRENFTGFQMCFKGQWLPVATVKMSWIFAMVLKTDHPSATSAFKSYFFHSNSHFVFIPISLLGSGICTCHLSPWNASPNPLPNFPHPVPTYHLMLFWLKCHPLRDTFSSCPSRWSSSTTHIPQGSLSTLLSSGFIFLLKIMITLKYLNIYLITWLLLTSAGM